MAVKESSEAPRARPKPHRPPVAVAGTPASTQGETPTTKWQPGAAGVSAQRTTVAKVEQVGVFRQLKNLCGPSSIATVLRQLGVTRVSPSDAAGAARLQHALYDSAYNTPALVKARGSRVTPDDTLGVHPTGMMTILEARGLDAVWHDADFDLRGVVANAETVPGGAAYISRRSEQIKRTTPELQVQVLRALVDHADTALAAGKSVMVRLAWGNDPERYHWSVIHGVDQRDPRGYILSEPGTGKAMSVPKASLRADCAAQEAPDQRCLKGLIVVSKPEARSKTAMSPTR